MVPYFLIGKRPQIFFESKEAIIVQPNYVMCYLMKKSLAFLSGDLSCRLTGLHNVGLVGICRSVVLSLLIFGVSTSFAEIYRWVDDQGKVHYGDRPPQEQTQEAETYSPNAGNGSKVSVDPELQDRQKKLLEKWQNDQKNSSTEEAESQRFARLQQERCNLLKNMQKQYKQSGRVYRETENGQRIYLSDDELAIELEKINDRIQSTCQ